MVGESITSKTSRRRFLTTSAGAAGAVALAGCSDNTSNGSNTVTVASLNPMSGAYSSLGPAQRAGVELAVKQINESDEYDYEINPVYDDTETESGAAQQAAQKVVQEEQADFVFGAISSSVALGINEFAKQSEFVYFPGGAAVPITGSKCNQWVFRFETNTAQIAEAISAYTVNEIGSNVWFHIADYAYGDSVYARTKERMQAANSGFTEVGKTESSLGSSNFGSYISQISNSDADAVILGMTGGDLVNFVNQAADRGLTDDTALVGPTMGFKAVRKGTGASSVGTYGASATTPPSTSATTSSSSKRSRRKTTACRVTSSSASGTSRYASWWRGMEKAGSMTLPTCDALEGGTFTTVLGDITLRESDHQATNPTWMAELTQGDGNMAGREPPEQGRWGADTLPPQATSAAT